MSSKVILKAEDLDGYLTEKDQEYLSTLDKLYEEAMESFKVLSSGGFSSTMATEEKKIISLYNEMGQVMQDVCKEVPGLKVFSFETQEESHAEASRVIAKLRDVKTGHQEFLYYTQRAFEMLFKLIQEVADTVVADLKADFVDRHIGIQKKVLCMLKPYCSNSFYKVFACDFLEKGAEIHRSHIYVLCHIV